MVARTLSYVLGAALAITAPAAAQTVQEAARLNLSLAAQLCLIHPVQPQERVARFQAAGFETRAQVNASDSVYTFTAPGNTAMAELSFGQMPEFCFAATSHLGVTEASAVLDEIAPRLYPGYLRKVTQGGVDPATGTPAQCVSYEDPSNPIGLLIGVNAFSSEGCVADGTSRIYSTYRV